MQGEIAQALFALRDGRGGAPHVAVDQRGQQREARERHRDERNDAGDDLGAGPLRRPGEAHHRVLGRVLQLEGVFAKPAASAARSGADPCSCSRAAISASTSSSMNLTVRTIGAGSRDIGFCDLVGRSDQHRRDHGRAAEELLHQRARLWLVRRMRRVAVRRCASRGSAARAGAAAHVIEGRRQLGQRWN